MRATAVPGALALLLAAAALAGCRLDAGAWAGRAETTAADSLALPVDGRVLVLDGFAGAVEVAEDARADAARVSWTRRARGATAASAARRLERVAVRTGGDEDLLQVVWRVDGREADARGARVDVRVVVPAGTGVVVRLAEGSLRARGLTAGIDAVVGEVALARRPPAGDVSIPE